MVMRQPQFAECTQAAAYRAQALAQQQEQIQRQPIQPIAPPMRTTNCIMNGPLLTCNQM
jgi:hypothetical protein